jgi:hypothetical protein
VPNSIDRITSRAAGNLEADDVTILLFRPNGSAPPVTLREKLVAPLRVWAGVIRSLFPGGGPAPLPDMSLPNIGGSLFGGLSRRWRGGSAHSTSLRH